MAEDFERDPRRRQEIRGRPIADHIYRQVFGEQVGIERMERAQDTILDVRFAIDVQLTLPTGMILTGQEKFLSHKYASFRTVTVEYWQNPQTQEPGDWFHLAPQFYFAGYAAQDSFDPWVLLDWPQVVLATHAGTLRWEGNQNKDGRARASFRFCRMDTIPDECVIACSFRPQRML